MPAGASRLCNLGTSVRMNEDQEGLQRFRFSLATEVEPSNDYNILTAGVYAVRLVVSCLNAKPLSVLLSLAIGAHVVKYDLQDGTAASFSLVMATPNIYFQVRRADQKPQEVGSSLTARSNNR